MAHCIYVPILAICHHWHSHCKSYQQHLSVIVRVSNLFCPAPIGWGIVHWWSLSVRLSVTCLTLSWKRKSLLMKLKIGRKEAHDTGDPWPHLEIKRSKIKVTRPIKAVTENQPYLCNRDAYKIQTWCADRVQCPASWTCAMTSKLKALSGCSSHHRPAFHLATSVSWCWSSEKGGEPLKWSLTFSLYIRSFPCAQLPGPVHTARLGLVFCVFSLGLCFMCSFVLFDLFVCSHSFMFPWAVESSHLQFLALA